ncbi:MAG: NAD(P)/FAD-dependent oxidoreductase [Myxococcota bacterium]
MCKAGKVVDVDENRSVWLAGKAPWEPLPPLSGDEVADVAVVGGGFTGVSTAWHLARRFPERRVVLLEARTLATGASGRNGGLLLNWVNGVDARDPAEAKRIYDATQEGVAVVDEMIRENGLAVRMRRDGTFDAFTDARRAEAARPKVAELQAAGVPIRWMDRDETTSLVALEGVQGGIFDPNTGQIDGVDLVRGMRPVLQKLGVGVYEGTPVTRIEEGEPVTLTTPGGVVRAKAVVLGTNAYTPGLGFFRGGVLALHSHVIATEPLPKERWDAIGWHASAGFVDDLDRIAYASMTPDGRLVFGGGSNAAYDYRFGGSPTWEGPADAAFAAVHARLCGYLPKARDVAITHRWTGAVAPTMSRVCTMGVTGRHRNVYYALGYSGHGITLANLAGKVLADVYAGTDERWRGLPFYQQRLLWIPPEPFRWIGYQVFTRLTGKSPRRSL